MGSNWSDSRTSRHAARPEGAPCFASRAPLKEPTSAGSGGERGPGLRRAGQLRGPVRAAVGLAHEIQQPEADRVIITHYNITPDGQEAKAVETVYQRKR